MAIERKATRYAHSDGHTDVCYSEDGNMLISCGTDGDIRIWSGFEDDDPVQTCVGEWSLCVRQKGKHLQIATDNNNVQLVTFPEGERDGILTKFTAPVNHMAVGKNHDFIAFASEDMEVKLMNLSGSKEENIIKSFNGLSGPPLSVALCPKAKMLAVSSGDGYLRIFDVDSQSVLKELNCVPKVNSFMNSKILCRIDFDPIHARYLAYPDKSSIIILNTSDWSTKQTLSTGAIDADYTIVQFSPCGNFLAAASILGDIVVWSITTDSLIDVTIHPKSTPICALAWNPNGNGEIAFCDTQGQLGIALNCNIDSENPEAETEPQENDIMDDICLGDVALEDDDEDNENAVSLEKLKKDIMGTGDSDKDDDDRSVSLPRSVSPRARTPEISLQETFMPTSTPVHLNPRYLCWNEVAVIRCYGSTEEDATEGGKSIEVEFHDSTFHNSMMMTNFQNYTMGTVSTSALVVANSSQVTVIPLSSGTKEWNVNLPEEEEVISVACSCNLICVATNNYSVRIFTIYGTQKGVFCVPGPLVSMSAFGCLILLAYHSAGVRKKDQCINMMLIKSEGMSLEKRDLNGALNPESTLHWLGFTDTGNPACIDTYGMLFIYPLKANVWMPFCDTTKHKNPMDAFFVTAVYETLNTVRGIKCRGAMYPGFTPRPTQMELDLQPSFIEMNTEKSQLEANLFMWSTLQGENTEKKYKETALKLFALACKNNLDQRAYELIELLENKQLLMLAMKYATKMEKRRLAEKLVAFASKIEADDEDDNDEKVEESTPSNAMKPLSKKITLSAKMRPKLKNATPTSSKQSRSNEDSGILTPVNNLSSTIASDVTSDVSINTQDSMLIDEPKNPFLKSSKKEKSTTYNPLSLTDKFAGINTVEKENKGKVSKETPSEKRKLSDGDNNSESVAPKEKQRKLDKFMFSKRS